MAIELFWISGSPFSWRVMLALACKGVPYESHLLQSSSGQLRSQDFLALNPRGQVPVLRDGETVVSESVAILAYLERRFPAPPLFGETPGESGRIWQRVLEVVCYLEGPGEAYILPIYFGEVASKTAQITAAVPVLRGELKGYEVALTGQPWLCGPRLSAADLTAYPTVKSILRAAQKPAAQAVEGGLAQLAQEFPAIAAWMTRIEGLPGYDATYPPHWRA